MTGVPALPARPSLPASPRPGPIVAAGLSAVTARCAAAVARRHPPLGHAVWERTNHAGRAVTLLEGPAWALGAAVPLALDPSRAACAGLLATAAAAALGALDDHAGTTSVKGLRGHLGALRRGEITTGAVKIVGLAAAGALATAVIDRPRRHRSTRGGTTELVEAVVGAGVVAASANLANLFDLRPGRALKVVLLTAPITAVLGPGPATLAAAAAGASLGMLPDDLAGRSMLGDTGANAAGALLGTAVVAGCRLPARALALAILSSLVLASERVSFSAVIEASPVLRAVDAWGRAT
ncbi:hypothetical protein [Arsenicicoccus cauae]|uniref:hypothetical protein n=1 Tax=Arsenicicoccus cauae TaxID=2663847 RepID=UPI002594D6D6|nr:hypothetical protein [Arsenicicoccus cauae]